MDWQSLLTAGGPLAGLLWLVVRAERGRADDARKRAEAAEKRADVLQEQIYILLGGALAPNSSRRRSEASKEPR